MFDILRRLVGRSKRGNAKRGAARAGVRRLACESLEVRALLSVTPAHFPVSLSDLPYHAQETISTTIGQDQAGYHAVANATGVALANAANGFNAQLQSGALSLTAGANTWGTSLIGISYGAAATPLGIATTSINSNRVDTNFSNVDEWFVNGPSGLEQGFNVTPQSIASGSLTVELALSGNLVATQNAAGTSLVLTAPNGERVLNYTGLSASDSTGKQLPASLQVVSEGASQELLIHVNDAGATGKITIDPVIQEAELTSSDGLANDDFGYSVAISGNTIVVGAPGATIGGNAFQGAVYVFTEPATGWASMTETAKLTASDGATDDELGYTVAISGNTVVAGAPLATIGANSEQGAAYVFVEPATGWATMTETAKLTSSDGAADDNFGNAVAISGNNVIVGAVNATVGANTGEGAAYIFSEPPTGWATTTETAKLTASDGELDGGFGESVAIDGNTAVVGAPGATIGANAAQGAVYVFTQKGPAWTTGTQTAKLFASDGVTEDFLGFSVAISGSTIVSGAVPDYVTGATTLDAAYVFSEKGGAWTSMAQTAKLTASDGFIGEGFSYSVATSGNIIVVGALGQTVNGNLDQGEVYAYTESGTAWANATENDTYIASDGAEDDNLGNGLAMSSSTVVAGAPFHTVGPNTSQGAAYVYQAPPILASITPTSGTTAGGTSVTITGTNLENATAVDFGTTPATITSDTSGVIMATSPAGAAGTVNVTVTTTGGTSAVSTSGQFTYIPPPAVTAVTPDAGPLAGGTTVTITGTGLANASTVDFGTNSAKIVSDTGSQIVVTDPPGAAGTVEVTVTTSIGATTTTTSGQFTYVAPPTVTGVTPTTGPTTGGTSVTIAGTNLTNATTVEFGTATATIISDTAAQIVVTSPVVAVAGTVNVTVTTAGGTTAISTSDQYTYFVPQPVVYAVTPTAGPTAGGTTVTISGFALGYASSVQFGSTAATLLSDTESQIVVSDPAGAPGTVDVTVTTAGGTSATSTSDQFTYVAPPAVSGLTPTRGPIGGGTTVTITGTVLSNATAVDFGTLPATIVSDTSSQIVVISPATSTPGLVDVTVTTVGGTSAISDSDKFDYFIPPPTVTGLTPAAGPTAGGTIVTISGTFFSGTTMVDFGSNEATIISVTSNQIVASSPAGPAGPVNVTVTTGGGTSSIVASDTFTYLTQASPASVSTTNASGTYLIYSSIIVQVTFDEQVVVTGSPQLSLNAGSGVTANYSGGSGTQTLSFLYTVEPGQATTDLDYTSTSALNLNGGTISDTAAVAASVTLPATGTDGLASKIIAVAPAFNCFESGHFTSWPWVLTSSSGSPSSNWTVQSSTVYDGSFSAESGPVGASSSSTLSVTLSASAGELSFFDKVSSSADSGYLVFEIDGTPVSQWTGSVGWQQAFYWVSAGFHTYTWVYFNGAGSSTGSAWLDDVDFAPGKTLTVNGTTANEAFSFNASPGAPGSIAVGLNSFSQSFTTSEFSTYVFIGGGGTNSASITGAASGTNYVTLYGNDTAALANSTAGISLYVAGASAIHAFGNSGDIAQLYGSAAGNDTFSSYADYNSTGEQFAGMTGSGYANTATGFGTNLGYSLAGASDTAEFYDASSTDVFYAYSDYSGQQLAGMLGSGYSDSAKGFATNVANSTNTSDIAAFFDAPGTNTYTAYGDYKSSGAPMADMTGTYGGGYSNMAVGFLTNVAYAVNGGSDSSVFYDSLGSNSFYAYADYLGGGKSLAGMYGSYGSGYTNSANGFANNTGYAVNGSYDVAGFYDSPGNDSFYAYADYRGTGKYMAGMYGGYNGGYNNTANGFSTVVGYSIEGGSDTASLYDAAGRNALYADAAIAELYGPNYFLEADGFSFVNAYGTESGDNIKGTGPTDYELNYLGTWING
jgi:hypothetical protein